MNEIEYLTQSILKLARFRKHVVVYQAQAQENKDLITADLMELRARALTAEIDRLNTRRNSLHYRDTGNFNYPWYNYQQYDYEEV